MVGIDQDAASLAGARDTGEGDGVEYLEGDFLGHPFPAASFDLVTAVASLHHMDEAAALARMAELLRPGGRLAVVGMARSSLPRDLPYELAGIAAYRLRLPGRTRWETPAPKVWPSPSTYPQLRRLSEGLLPGRAFRRRAMWRYLLTWTRPR